MNNNEQQEKLNEYRERHLFWTERVLEQFGFSVNLFFTLSIGFIGFLATQRNQYPSLYISLKSDIEWRLVFYYLIMLLVFFSIIIGSICVFSRLYDLRLTRHLIWVRKRTVKKIQMLLPENYLDLSKNSHSKNFRKTITGKINFINENDMQDPQILRAKFQVLRRQSKLLSELSWRTHKIQVIFIVLSVFIYGILFI